MRTRADIVAAARAWCGVPFRRDGRNWQGVDCAGLVIVVAWTIGLPAADVRSGRGDPDPREFMAAFGRQMDQVAPLDLARDGDVVLLLKPGELVHSAILSTRLGRRHIIHAYARLGCVLEEPLGTAWAASRRAAFAYRGVA